MGRRDGGVGRGKGEEGGGSLRKGVVPGPGLCDRGETEREGSRHMKEKG